MRISLEDGQKLDQGEEAVETAASGTAPRSASEIARGDRLIAVTTQVLAGEAPRGRELKTWEMQTLAPLHIQILFDRADGMRTKALAEKYGMAESRMSVILHHPDSEYFLGEVMGVTADRIADPIERMKSFAQEMINVKLDIIRDEETPRVLKNDIASDFLDRAGYGARKKLDVETKHSVMIPAAAAARLSDALDASRRVASVDYSTFLAPKLLEGTTQGASAGSAMTQGSQADLMPSGGHSSADNGASPDDLPAASPIVEADWKHEERLAREEFEQERPRSVRRRIA